MANPPPGQASFALAEEPGGDAPLAARMRPRTLDEVAGQEQAIGPGSMLRQSVAAGRLPSVIFWGPPGCGKTTIARLLAGEVEAELVQLSAVSAGVRDIRATVEQATAVRRAGRRTVLFLDEIHRFNKAQQDALLPYVEDGTLTLIGATTENPSFEVIAPLLSRTRVIRLGALGDDEIGEIVDAAAADTERGLGNAQPLEPKAREALVTGARGDARAALTALEIAAGIANDGAITTTEVASALQASSAYYDKSGDAHYDTVSAFIKSMRGSDVDASLYWLARMMQAGEDPLFIVRRMVIFASEDVGLADPQALVVATACQQAVHFVGMPEGALIMAECCAYLALAPKSNSTTMAIGRASAAAEASSHLPPPLRLRQAPTGMMRAMGYGAGYRYPHAEEGHVARGERYLPDEFEPDAPFYQAGTLGAEREMGAWLARTDGDIHREGGGNEPADED